MDGAERNLVYTILTYFPQSPSQRPFGADNLVTHILRT